MPRVTADVDRLTAHADLLAELDTPRALHADTLQGALVAYFATNPIFGPTSSPVVDALAALRMATAVDAAGCAATAAVFAEVDTLTGPGAFSDWEPTDEWVERRRRAWLGANAPWAMGAAAPSMDPAAAARRVREIDEQLATMRGRSGFPLAAVEALVAEREAILAEGAVLVDALTDAIGAWSGTDNDPALDQLVSDRAELIDLLAEGDAAIAARMLGLISGGLGAGRALTLAVGEAEYDARLTDVMEASGVSREEAIEVLQQMDLQIAALIEHGATPEEAVVAFAMADHLDLDLDLAQRLADRAGVSVVEALGRMATADALDMSDDQLAAFEGFRAHFDAFDNARGGSLDGAVSEADLLYVVDNPELFLPAQVLAAQAILDEPVLRNRLDTAAENIDILDEDSFGRTEPGDRLISVADIDAFLTRSQLNNLLADYRIDIDTAANGGDADGTVSRNDLQTWLEANPDAPIEVRDGVQYLLDAELFDQSWLERNRDALAMGAAVLAGGVVIVLSGGTGAPLVIGFMAGAASAGLTTVGVNHLTGQDLTDGVLSNTIEGGFMGMAVAGLPASWTSASAITQGLTLRSGLSATVFSGEVAGVVSGGGLDLVLPDDWEDEVHAVANGVEYAGMVADLAEQGLEVVIRTDMAEAAADAPTSGLDVGLSDRGVRPLPGTRVRPEGIPENWRISGTRSRGGTIYTDPLDDANNVRIMQGNPRSRYPNSRVPYVRWERNGEPLDVNGNQLLTERTPEAHIPLEDFVFDLEVFE